MKKTLALFAALLAFMGLRAQTPQVKKETTKPNSTHSQAGVQRPAQRTAPVGGGPLHKIAKAGVKKPFTKLTNKQQ